MNHPLRLTCSQDSLVANWRWLAATAGVECGAAIKADGYGIGASDVARKLRDAGCRTFFVSNWAEAEALGAHSEGTSLVVLHGVAEDDNAAAASINARPTLNTPEQVARWKRIAPTRPCDVMIDTGMNRLGLRAEEAAVLDGLVIDTLHSHLACADEDHPLNALQLHRFREAAAIIPAQRYSLANSAGICLGREYSFDLVRPGLALYGGIPRAEAKAHLKPVAAIEAQVVQQGTVRAGESIGYGATFVAPVDIEVAIINIGYADGYWRAFATAGRGWAGEVALPVVGRVSMDLVTLDCSAAPDVREGDWITLDFDLEASAQSTGMTQYELLTGLGHRFERVWR